MLTGGLCPAAIAPKETKRCPLSLAPALARMALTGPVRQVEPVPTDAEIREPMPHAAAGMVMASGQLPPKLCMIIMFPLARETVGW